MVYNERQNMNFMEGSRSMGREFELKYAATADILNAMAAQFSGLCPIAMETTYYDTPGRDLSARRCTLRRRLENGRAVCTLKTPQAGHSRGEWELEGPELPAAAEALLPLGGLEDLSGADFVPVCGARFTRLAKTVALADCTLELALDQGALLGGGREQPFWEVEVELKSGAQDAAVAYARALARKYGLKAEEKSKFCRALALADGK